MNTTVKTVAALVAAGSSDSGSSAPSSTASAAPGTTASGSPTGSPAGLDHRTLLGGNPGAGALGSSVVGGTPAPASIGTDSLVVSGTSPDGTKSVTVLLFTQGNAFTTIEFDSGTEDPVPPEVVVDIADKQTQKIAAGLK